MGRANFNETVTAAEISRNFGEWQSRAMQVPVTITHHGRPRLMLLSIDLFNETAGPEPGGAVEQDVAHTNGQLRAILNQIHSGFMAFDKDLRVIDINPAAELFLGLARAELIGRDMRDLVPQSRTSIAWDFYRRVLQTGETLEFRVRSTLRSGPPLKVQAFPYDDVGVGVLFSNLSSQEEVRVLKERDDAMKAALQFEPAISLLRLNARGVIEEVDEHFCAMSGFSAAQLGGLMLTELANAKERPLLQRALNAAIREDMPKAVSAAIVTREGAEKRLRFNMSLVTHESVPEDVMVWAIDGEVARFAPT